MLIETPVRHPNKVAVKVLFVRARLAAANQQNCPSCGVEREGNPPFGSWQCEAQFFHVRVFRPLRRVAPRPAKKRPKLPKKTRQSVDLIEYCFRLGRELGQEIRIVSHFPFHDFHLIAALVCCQGNMCFMIYSKRKVAMRHDFGGPRARSLPATSGPLPALSHGTALGAAPHCVPHATVFRKCHGATIQWVAEPKFPGQ